MEETIHDMECTNVSNADGHPPQQEGVEHVTTGSTGLATTNIPVSAPGGTSEAKEPTYPSAESEKTTAVGNATGEASAVAKSSPAAPGVEKAAAEATPQQQTQPMHKPAVAGETARPQANMHELQDRFPGLFSPGLPTEWAG